jgi:hypothetical protein
MNPHRPSVMNSRSATGRAHRHQNVCARAFKQWFSQVVMMDDPYDEAEQKQIAEKLRLELAFSPDNISIATGFYQSSEKSLEPEIPKLWIYPPHPGKYQSLV